MASRGVSRPCSPSCIYLFMYVGTDHPPVRLKAVQYTRHNDPAYDTTAGEDVTHIGLLLLEILRLAKHQRPLEYENRTVYSLVQDCRDLPCTKARGFLAGCTYSLIIHSISASCAALMDSSTVIPVSTSHPVDFGWGFPVISTGLAKSPRNSVVWAARPTV